MLIQERLSIISQIATYKISTRCKLVKKKIIKISYSTVMHSPNLITKKDYLCTIDFSCCLLKEKIELNANQWTGLDEAFKLEKKIRKKKTFHLWEKFKHQTANNKSINCHPQLFEMISCASSMNSKPAASSKPSLHG